MQKQGRLVGFYAKEACAKGPLVSITLEGIWVIVLHWHLVQSGRCMLRASLSCLSAHLSACASDPGRLVMLHASWFNFGSVSVAASACISL